ncbi:DUF5719 family protein [Microbacterium aurum]|uniref:DUF5719 family protein n=1 Tax=Microbacterium aurum TaxID=36805 RepID=UPI0028E3A5A7|nr:DUF5719 family protein [Microbacterium aurum]
MTDPRSDARRDVGEPAGEAVPGDAVTGVSPDAAVAAAGASADGAPAVAGTVSADDAAAAQAEKAPAASAEAPVRPAPAPRHPSGRFGPVRLGIGLVVAVVAASLGVSVAVLPVSGLLPAAAGDRAAVELAALPPAGPSIATCAGPVLAAGRDSANASVLADAAPQSLTGGAAGGVAPESTTLQAPDVADGAGPAVLTVPPTDGAVTDLAAAGSATVAASDLSGFAASACTRAAMESWIVAGSATTGAADLVVLANPGDVAARVTITVYGATGPAVPAAGAGIVVAAGTQRVVPLAALALGEENPILQITAAEAPVRASLQASLTRILVPGGLDQVGASAVPTEQIVIPGVPVVTAPGTAGESDVATSLRLLAPAADANASVVILRNGGAGGATSQPQDVALTAGIPLQLDLSGLEVGTYTVVVTASAPVTGAVRAASGFGAGSDFGWFAAADEVTAPALVAVADGPAPQLTLASTSDTAQTVGLTGIDGARTDVTVPAGGSVTVPVTAGAVYRIEPGDDGIRAAVTYATGGAVAGYPVPAGDAAASAITVYPR